MRQLNVDAVFPFFFPLPFPEYSRENEVLL